MSAEEPGNTKMGHLGSGFAATLSDCILSGVVVVNGSQRVESLTSSAAKMLNLETGKTAGRSIEILPAALQEIIHEIAKSGELISNRRVQWTSPEAGLRRLRVNAFAISNDSKQPLYALILSELDCAPFVDQNLRQLDRLASAGTLASSMAHEIRNALVAGKTFIDLLLERNQDTELVEIVRREFGRIDSIVGQMLKLAAPSKPEFTTIRVHETLEHALRLVQSRLQSESISLHRYYGATPDLVPGDDYQLEQAFLNIFLNAVEAMGHNGQLHVTTRLNSGPPPNVPINGGGSPPGHLLVSIRDTGGGISAENMQRLFEPFFTTKANGTGLGLLITRRIIEEHHGGISVESEPNRGAVFNILLPTPKAIELKPQG